MARKKAAEQARMNKLRSTPKALASASKDVTGFPFLGARTRTTLSRRVLPIASLGQPAPLLAPCIVACGHA